MFLWSVSGQQTSRTSSINARFERHSEACKINNILSRGGVHELRWGTDNGVCTLYVDAIIISLHKSACWVEGTFDRNEMNPYGWQADNTKSKTMLRFSFIKGVVIASLKQQQLQETIYIEIIAFTSSSINRRGYTVSLISEDIIGFSNLQFNYVVPFIFGKRDTRYICLEVGFDSARGDCMNIKLVWKWGVAMLILSSGVPPLSFQMSIIRI